MSRLVSVVIPFRNESAVLADTIANLAHTTRRERLSGWRIAVIGVDNDSQDGSAEVFLDACAASGLTLAKTLHVAEGEVVTARREGFAMALREFPNAMFIVSLDADTSPHQGWFPVALNGIAGGFGAVSFVGTFPKGFWTLVPRLRSYYEDEIGDIFFDVETEGSLGYCKGSFNKEVFWRLGRTLVDQFFVISPQSYVQSGGHKVRRLSNGHEVLHEGGRLAFEMSKAGHSILTAALPRYETNPRRLIGEAAKLFSGASYKTGMSPYRHTKGEVADFFYLEEISSSLNFHQLRSYVVRNYIIFQVLCQPSRVKQLENWIPKELCSSILEAANSYFSTCRTGFDAIIALDEFDRSFGTLIQDQWKEWHRSSILD